MFKFFIFIALFFKCLNLKAHHKIYSPRVEEGRQSLEWRGHFNYDDRLEFNKSQDEPGTGLEARRKDESLILKTGSGSDYYGLQNLNITKFPESSTAEINNLTVFPCFNSPSYSILSFVISQRLTSITICSFIFNVEKSIITKPLASPGLKS